MDTGWRGTSSLSIFLLLVVRSCQKYLISFAQPMLRINIFYLDIHSIVQSKASVLGHGRGRGIPPFEVVGSRDWKGSRCWLSNNTIHQNAKYSCSYRCCQLSFLKCETFKAAQKDKEDEELPHNQDSSKHFTISIDDFFFNPIN